MLLFIISMYTTIGALTCTRTCMCAHLQLRQVLLAIRFENVDLVFTDAKV